jgi:hypothetical protein
MPQNRHSGRILYRINMTGFVWNWPIALFFLLVVPCLTLMAAALRQARFRPNPLILGVWSLWMLWVSLSPVWYRLNAELDGQIISARDIPPTRGPRYATVYTLRSPDGRQSEYVAGATSDSLPRSMPIGTYLKKPKWTIYYERDGTRCDTGVPWFSVVITCFAIGCLVWSVRTKLSRQSQPASNSSQLS